MYTGGDTAFRRAAAVDAEGFGRGEGGGKERKKEGEEMHLVAEDSKKVTTLVNGVAKAGVDMGNGDIVADEIGDFLYLQNVVRNFQATMRLYKLTLSAE